MCPPEGEQEYLNQYRVSSVPLDAGGDTHFHQWDSGNGVTVTTRLGGGIEFQNNIRLSNLLRVPEAPDAIDRLP